MNVQWEDLRFLEAIERTGKVAAAARELNVSLSTLYRRVSELEADIGQLCLYRGPAGGTLTETGHTLALVGRRTRKSVDEVLSQLRAQATKVEGEVSLTTVIALLPFIEEPLARLSAAHPSLHVTLHLGDDGPSVREREVDVALAIMKRPPQGCWGRRLTTLRSGVFATKEAAAREPRRFLVRSLAEVHSPESAWERAHAQHVAARVPYHALPSLCARGLGAALLPHLLASKHPKLVELPEYSKTMEPLDRPLWLLTHGDLRRVPRVLAVMDALAATFAPQEARS